MKILFKATKDNEKIVDILNVPPTEEEDPVMHHLWQGVKHELTLQELDRGSVVQLGDMKKPHWIRWKKRKEWNECIRIVRQLVRIEQEKHVQQMYRSAQ